MGEQARPVAERFMKALQSFESDGNVDPLVALFHDDAECVNLVHAERGRGGVRKFWEEYRGAFEEIHSQFTTALFADAGASLEWTSEGALPTGAPIEYRGVSVLEVDGDRVKRFRTYYDSAAFVAPAGK
ncbi:MAG TPA: nuclear transport factor 2 family protein [Gemmata sp.]|nr:nuclear transport factor 2 family protein [Gemmata sp.]